MYIFCLLCFDTVGWKSIRPVKIEWRCWCSYLSGARCRLFPYGPADATAIPKPHHLLHHLNPDWFYLSGTGLHINQVVLEKRPLNRSSSSSSSSSRCMYILYRPKAVVANLTITVLFRGSENPTKLLSPLGRSGLPIIVPWANLSS